MEASATPPQRLAASPRSGPGAGADGISLGQFQAAQVPTALPTPFPETRDQPAPIQDALESLALLPGGCAPGSHFKEVPRD